METEDRVPYFFEQKYFRIASKRYKKLPEELPHDLRFAHLNPRIAAYLASKEKENSKDPGFVDDGLGNKSLLPQINHTVSLLKEKLNELMADEDIQRFLFKESKISATDLLERLAGVLLSL